MPNMLFNTLGGKLPANDNGFSSMMEELEAFKRSFRGDPRERVQELLRTGQMSQAQYNQLGQMATQIMGLMGQK